MQEREEIHKIIIGKEFANIKDKLSRLLFDAMGGNAQIIEWSDTHNMNDYKNAGTYRIKGLRTNSADNLPIMNAASGHSIDGILFVLDSTLSEDNTSDEYNACITQFLMLSNRVGGQEGDTYMRSAYGPTKDNITWKPWEKYQTNMEVGVMSDTATHNPNDLNQILDHNRGLRDLTDNGIYSGVYLPPGFTSANDFETFVMVAINNYAMTGDAKTITQIKFALTNAGSVSFKKRTTAIGGNDWSAWDDFVGGSGVSDYELLSNKPSINKVILDGNKTAEELGLQPKGEYPSVEDVNKALAALAEQIPTDYLTKEDLNGYAKTSDIPSVQGLASEDYVQEQIAENSGIDVVSQTATTATIQPNVLNVWGEVASLNLSFAEGEEGKVNEYLVQFTSGATATTLVLPDSIQWMAAPNIQANKTYQLSVVNNLGIIGEFGNE